MQNRLYVAIDGNEIGKIIDKYILSEELEKLGCFSRMMNKCVADIESFILDNHGLLIMAGGDNIFAELPEAEINSLKDYVAKKNKTMEFDFSVGFSTSPLGAYLALKYAKANHLFSVFYEDGSICEC